MFDNEDEREEILLRPFNYLLQIDTYGFLASRLTNVFNYWLKIPNNRLEQIKEITVSLNHAIAMIDDIEDYSEVRRAVPSAHRVFGVPLALNASLHAQLLALKKIIKLGYPQGAEIFCSGMLGCWRGQGIDIYWRENFIEIDYDNYRQMTAESTGLYIGLIVKLMQLFSDNKTDYKHLLDIFSTYYQARDDYCHLVHPQAIEEREREHEFKDINEVSFLGDLTIGKLSWPMIHALKSQHRHVILSLLKQHPRDMATKRYILQLMEGAGSLEFTRQSLRKMETEIRNEITRLNGNPLFEELLNSLHNWDETDKIKKANGNK